LNNASSLSVEVSVFETILSKLNKVLLLMISAYEVEEVAEEQSIEQQSVEKQLKELTGLFKLLQGVEEMLKHAQENRDRRRESGIDALEFRRKLEEQIEKLVDEDAEGEMSKPA